MKFVDFSTMPELPWLNTSGHPMRCPRLLGVEAAESSASTRLPGRRAFSGCGPADRYVLRRRQSAPPCRGRPGKGTRRLVDFTWRSIKVRASQVAPVARSPARHSRRLKRRYAGARSKTGPPRRARGRPAQQLCASSAAVLYPTTSAV